jgi:hypothetical protein
MESYHSNLKSILFSSKQKLVGRCMDWLIHHLIGDVITHYWYNRQLKEYEFIRNSKEEFIVVSAIIRAREIPNDYVWLYLEGEDFDHVGSVNHKGKVWTVYCPDME